MWKPDETGIGFWCIFAKNASRMESHSEFREEKESEYLLSFLRYEGCLSSYRGYHSVPSSFTLPQALASGLNSLLGYSMPSYQVSIRSSKCLWGCGKSIPLVAAKSSEW